MQQSNNITYMANTLLNIQACMCVLSQAQQCLAQNGGMLSVHSL